MRYIYMLYKYRFIKPIRFPLLCFTSSGNNDEQ